PQQPDQVTGSQPSSCAQEPGHTQPLHDGDSSQVAWSLTGWDGNVTELRRKLTGLTISHDLKCEIHLILEHADPSRYSELLAFLVNTAPQLSLPEREQLRSMDLSAEHSADVTALLQKVPDSISDSTAMANRKCPSSARRTRYAMLAGVQTEP
ncbi:hypothetical protein F443_05181, partial [Phytophthora nicotianae P1569]